MNRNSILCCQRADCQDTDCPGREIALHMHQNDGGITFHRGVVFPIERDVDEHELIAEPARQVEGPSPFWFGLLAVMRFLPVAMVLVWLVVAMFFPIPKGTP
jgi:hypothetical protein